MNRVLIGKVSQKGQVVIPIRIRKALGLKKGSKVSFELKNGEITIKKVLTALDWTNLVKQIPVEDVKIDKNGYFDPRKSPDFHDWMVNG